MGNVKRLLTLVLAWLKSFLVGQPSRSTKAVMDSADVLAVLRAAVVGAIIVFLTKIDSADWGLADPLVGAVIAAAIEWFGAYQRDNEEGEEEPTVVEYHPPTEEDAEKLRELLAKSTPMIFRGDNDAANESQS